jgi:hypothetical protein
VRTFVKSGIAGIRFDHSEFSKKFLKNKSGIDATLYQTET